jgi:HNH endonuclease.
MQTEWRTPKSIPFFLVSADGDVVIKDTMKKARIADNGNGYKQVQIMRGCKRYTRYVHRLVAECFIDNPDGLPEINHKDGNKLNNSADNLEWCNHSDNLKHAYRTGLKPNTTPKQQEAARKSIVKAKEVAMIAWREWAKTEEAREVWMKNLSKRCDKKGA